jgi:hypothetical protein
MVRFKLTAIQYLGITLQTNGNIFNMHIKMKVATTICVMADIQNLSKLLLKTAVRLFNSLNVQPGNSMRTSRRKQPKILENIKALRP